MFSRVNVLVAFLLAVLAVGEVREGSIEGLIMVVLLAAVLWMKEAGDF